MSNLSSQFLVDQVEDDSLDALLSASDDAIAMSQAVFTSSIEHNTTPSINNNDDHHFVTIAMMKSFPDNTISESTWFHILATARSRCDPDCAICMNSLMVPRASHQSCNSAQRHDHYDEDEEEGASSLLTKTRVVLSCSHVFHEACLSAFERFNLTSIAKVIKSNVCPMCRATYEKRQLSNNSFTFRDSIEEEEEE